MPRRREPFRAQEGVKVTERLERRNKVMAAYTSHPGQPLDADQAGELAGLPGRQAKAIIAVLEADGWLCNEDRR